MLQKLLLILSLSVVPSAQALIYFNGYGQFHYGSIQNMDEVVSPGSSLAHDGWTIGIGAGARVGISFRGLTIGGVVNYDRLQYEGERQDGFVANAFDGAEDYDNALTRTMSGWFVDFEIPSSRFSIIGEHYAKIWGKITYAEPRGENIFAQDDNLRGEGFGVGLGFNEEWASGNLLLRHLVYDEFTLLGNTTPLPSSQFGKLKGWEIAIQIGFEHDWL